MNEEVLKKIWEDTSKSDSTFTADYDQFKSAMSMYPNFRNSIYDGIRERDKGVKATNQDWDNFLGFNSSVTTIIEEPKVNKSLRNEAYSDMSDDDLQGKYNDMLKKAEQRKKEAIEKAKLEQSKMSKERPLLYAFSQAGAQSSYGASAPNAIQAIEQSSAELFLDENDKNEYDSLHKEIGVRGYESGYEGIKKSTEEEENRVKNIRSNAELDGNKLTARDKSMLRKAEKINSDARELVEAGSKYGNESGIENWIDGLSNTLIDRDMIAGVGLIRDMKVDNMVEKLNNGEELSEAEGALLLAAYNFEEVAKTRSFDLSTGYKIGQGTAESVPFILDMMLTKGLIGGGKKALLKFFASKGKDVAKLARVMDVSLDGSKVARATTGEKLLHGAYELGETAVQTAMMPSSQRQMMQEKTEIRKATGENDISLKDRARIFGNAYVQTFTERKGGEMIDWALGKMLPVGNLMARFGYKEGIVKSLNDVIQSPLSEVGEEYLGAAINLLRSIDLLNLYSEDSNEDMRDEALSIFSTEGLGEIVGSTLPISLLGGAVNATSIATSTNRFNKAHIAFAKKLEEAGATQTQAENILSKLESANSQDEFNERLDIARGFLKKHIQETETDLGIANTKMHEVDGLIDNYKESATTFNNAVKDLRTLYVQLPQEKKDAAKADFENMRRKINESITMTHPQEGPAVVSKRPTSGWKKRTMSVKIDGKNTKVTFSGDVVFNEDGSINTSLSNMDNFRLQNDKGQNIRTTVKGEEAKKRKFDIYLNAVNDALRKEKEKRDNEIAAQKAAEEARKAELKRIEEEEKKKVEEENAKLEAQKQAIAAQEADRQSIIASFPKDKNGEVDIDKMSPEQFFVYESDTDTPEAAMNTVGDVLNDLYQQLEDNTNEANREKRARNAAKIKNRIRQYEAVVVKYAGQETLDAINASRIAPAAPIEEGPAAPQEQAPAPAVEPVAEPEPVQEVEQSATEKVSDTKDAAIEENKTEEKVRKPSYDIETEVNDGTIKLLFSPNSKGQWYVVRNGEVISRSLNANRKKLPDNTREVADAKVKYIKTADDNYIPILLFSESTKNDTLKGEKQVMLQDGSVTIVKASEMFDKISETEYIPTQSNTTKKEAQRKERAKYSTFDAVLKYPVVNFSDGTVLTFADVLGLGFEKKKNSQYVTPYDRVIEMINIKESNEDVLAGKKKAFREDYKKVAQYWNAVVDAKYEGNEKLKMAVDLSVGKHDTSGRVMASSMIAADNAIDLGLVSVIIEDKFLTIPTKWGGEKAETTWVKNMTDEEIVDKVTSLTDGLQDDIQKYTALEEKAKTIEEDKKAAEALSFEVDIKEMSEEELKDMETLGVSINKQQRAVRDFLKKLNESQLEIVSKSISPSQLYAKNIIKKYIDRIQKAGIKNKQEATKAEKEVAKGAAAATNSKNNVLQKVSAKRDSVKLIDNMTEQEALDIYKRYIQGNAPANMTAEQVASVIEMLKASKHGAAIEAEEARIKALQEEYLRSSQAEQEETTDSEKEAEQVQTETDNDTIEISTQNQTPVSVESLRSDIEKLSAELERIDSLPNPTQEQLDRANAIFAEIQQKNTQLDAMGNKWEDNTNASAAAAQAAAMQDIADEEASLENQRKALREELNTIQSNINEFVYETDEEIDAANARLAEIKEQLRSVGEFMIGDIAESSASKESKELALASEIQSLAGSEDIEVMDTTAEQIEESTPLMTSNGVIYGYAAGNKIYLTPDGMNTNTPVHEYTHIWAKAMQKHNPKAWKSIVEQLKKADALWNEVVNDHNYENIKGNDDAIASEVLSRYSGKNGAAKLEAEAERVVTEYKGMEKGLKVKALISRVKKALEKFWSWVGKDLFKIESFESVESIADRVLYDMLNNTKLNLDNSKKSSTFAENNENYERTDEFRELQERSNSLPESTIAEYHSEEREFSDEDRRRVGGVFQRLMESERNGGRNAQWINLTGKGNQFKMAQVNPAIFHDIFQICRNYLPNGELVDLHDNYADCKCFISEDGLCGFAIEPNGNLISVFSLNPSDKKGFLYAIKDLIRQEGATHLDCFVSNKQPLAEIYQKALGFHVASEMDYNMEYDHDNIAENHGMPKVAFMVDKPTEKREFDGESYDAAYDYQQSQTSTAEREQIIAEAKANGTFMTAPNGQPTNLTEDQWVATRTQAFKDYFGDWQNEPANASVVLDENGEPLVVYHGSRMAGFDKFGRGEARDSQGIYTTPNRRAAESYATSKEEWKSGQTMPEAELGVPDHHGVYSLFVNMRNPKVIDFEGKEFDRFGTPKYEVATNEAIDNGERGILFDTLEEAEAYIAEHPDEDLDYVEKYTTSDDLLVQAKEEGYDGVIFTNIIDSRYRDPITNYVPFEPNQVKSATQNVGTFNPGDDRIEFMIGPVINENQKEGIERASNKLVKGIAANVPLPERIKSAGELWSEIGDSGEVFRQILKSLREFNAKHGLSRKLPEGSDVRQIYTNSRTVLANKIKELKNLYENPLRKNFEELIEVVKSSSMYEKYKKEIRTVEKEVLQEDGTIKYELTQIEHELTPREFIERYLIACDNIERFQKNIPTRGLAVFKQWMGVDVMEFQIEFEAAFGASKEGEALLKSLWKSINDYTNYTLEDSFACEMITPEEYYKRKDRKFYIPERDFAIDKDLDQPDVSPKKRYRSNKLSSSIKAKGGESLAANILENMIHIGNVDLQKNNKNRVKLAMWNLLQDNPEFRESIGLPKPYEVWYDKDGKRVTSTPTREEREHMRLVQEDILQLENLLEEELSKDEELQDKAEIDSLREELNKVYKERDSIPYLLEYEARNRFQSEGDPNVVGLYVNGTLCSMSFPNMSLAAIALNDTWDKAPRLWGPIRWIKGLWSSVITTLEPSFFLINTATDGLSIVLKGAIQYDIEFSLRYIATAKDILKNGRLVGSYVLGKDYRSLENGELFRDFLMNGGNTGYASVKNMEQILKDLEYLDREHSSLEEAMKQVKKSLSFMNECTELLLRFAAYKTAIDMGKGVEEAINASNNLSANFNRRGEAVPLGDTVTWHKKAFVNLMRHFKEFSMFFNPAVQGAMQFWRMFGESGALDSKEKAERWFKIFTNAMFLPALAGFINTMICEDDEEEEWSVSEYDRANYFIIGKNGKFPIGHMLRPFYNIGVNIALGMQGRRGAGDIADSIITSFLTHLTPCAPSLSNMGVKVVHNAFGGQELTLWDFLQSFTTPESLAVLNEAADGVNFMGQQVKYDDEKTAMYTKNPNAGTFEKLIAQLVFYAGGGEWGGTTTLKRNGEGDVHDMFNVTPNEVKTFLSLWMPKSILNTTNVVAGAIQNRIDESRGEYVNNNIKLKNVPFISSFISERTPEAYRSGIYSEANKISRANKLVMDKAYKEMVRISVQLQSEMTEEEYIKLERRYEHFESIYNQAASDVIADAIREILPAYKEARFSNLQKRFSMNEKELKKYMSDIDYDSLEENERELIFNLSQLVQMKEGCGPVNSKIPQWMKGVFKVEPTSAEVQELWDTYEEYIEE